MKLSSSFVILATFFYSGTFHVASARYLGAREQLIEPHYIQARKESCLPVIPKENDNTTWPAYAASQHGVPSFLDAIKRTRIDPSKGNTGKFSFYLDP